jgi:uncharacterized glyoxalase superfamily protein PhnB
MSLNLDAIGIVVKDMQAALAFYRKLGVAIEPNGHNEDHVEAVLPNGVRLMWDTVQLAKQFDPHWEEPKGQRMSLAFLCDSAQDVDQMFSTLTGAGYQAKLEPFDAFWGQRYASVYDPDGNGVEFFAPLEAK